MNERRRFLQVVSGSTVGLALGCGGSSKGGGAGGESASSSSSSASSASGASGATSTSGEASATSSSGASGSSSSGASASTGSSTSTSSGAACENDPPGTKLEDPSAYTEGLNIVANEGLLVGRDSGGLYCLTAICTHQMCDMSAGNGGLTDANEEIRCFCHGSLFSATGAVVNGPAHAPLKAYALALGCDGALYADQNTVVPNTQRLKV